MYTVSSELCTNVSTDALETKEWHTSSMCVSEPSTSVKFDIKTERLKNQIQTSLGFFVCSVNYFNYLFYVETQTNIKDVFLALSNELGETLHWRR